MASTLILAISLALLYFVVAFAAICMSVKQHCFQALHKQNFEVTYEKTPTEEEAEPDVSAPDPAHKGLLYGMMQSNQVHDVSNLTEKCGLNYIYLSCSHVLNLISLPQE